MESEREKHKHHFRQRCLKRLREESRQGAYAKDRKVLAKLYDLIQKKRADTIMLYLPLKTEVNLYPLIRRLRREGKEIYVPFMEGKSFRLVKYRYPLRTKRFGIKEPNISTQYRKKQIDIAVVPIVGMDRTYRRVGFGKGMYDRFFEKETENIETTVFVARTLCFSKTVVTDDYDVKADLLIVP